MLGVAGVLLPEILHNAGTGGPAAAQEWYNAGAGTYFAPASTLFAVQLFLFSWVEFRRLQDYNKPGSANQDPIFSNNKLPGASVAASKSPNVWLRRVPACTNCQNARHLPSSCECLK